jgi:hypothetical protein
MAERYQGCNQNLYIIELPLGIFWPLCCLFFYDIQILITPWYLLAIVLSFLLWFTDSDYTLGIFWQLCCLFFYDIQILIIPRRTDNTMAKRYQGCNQNLYIIEEQTTQWPKEQILIISLVSFGHCVVFSSMIYRFWLHPWYLLAIVLSVLLWYTDSETDNTIAKRYQGSNQNLYNRRTDNTMAKRYQGVIRICIS